AQIGCLFGEDAVKFRRGCVRRDSRRHQRAQRGLEAAPAPFDEDRAERCALLVAVAPAQLGDDGFLVWKVLIQRGDVDAGPLRDSVRGERAVAATDQNVSRRFQQRVDGRPGSVLTRRFPRGKLPFGQRHPPLSKCKLTNISKCLHYSAMQTKTAALTHRRVARAIRAGGPEVLDIESEALRPLEPGEALVRVEAAGLNHVDSLVRSGTYSIRASFPYGVGVEGAGTVVAVASDVAIVPGTRVCWTAIFGSCATFVIAPARMLARLPDGLSFDAGASLAHAAVTAAGLVRHCPLPEESAVVVWGAAGAVGRLLVASLADRGATVIGVG